MSYTTPRRCDNPKGFDPDRFTPELARDRHRFAYFPFGGGPRLYIGRDVAMMEMQLILAMVTQRFRLDIVPGRPAIPRPRISLKPAGGTFFTLHAPHLHGSTVQEKVVHG